MPIFDVEFKLRRSSDQDLFVPLELLAPLKLLEPIEHLAPLELFFA